MTYVIPGSVARGEADLPWRGQVEAASPEEALRYLKRERPRRRAYTVQLGPDQRYFGDGHQGRTLLARIQIRACRTCAASIVIAEDQRGRWHCLDPLPLGGPSGELDTYARHICRPPTGDTA